MFLIPNTSIQRCFKFYNQVILYVNQYKSGLKNVNIALDEITFLIEDELKS